MTDRCGTSSKHHLKHDKPFRCYVSGCRRHEGFMTANDLERHQRCVHNTMSPTSGPIKFWRCAARNCQGKEKSWLRLDNFRNHLKRMHPDEDLNKLVRQSEVLVAGKPQGGETVEGTTSRNTSITFEPLPLLPPAEFPGRLVASRNELIQHWPPPVSLEDPLHFNSSARLHRTMQTATTLEQTPKHGQGTSTAVGPDLNQDINDPMPLHDDTAVETVNNQPTVPVEGRAAVQSVPQNNMLTTASNDVGAPEEVPTSKELPLGRQEIASKIPGLCNKVIEIMLEDALPGQLRNADGDKEMRGPQHSSCLSSCTSGVDCCMKRTADSNTNQGAEGGTEGAKRDQVQQCPHLREMQNYLKSETMEQKLQAIMRTDLLGVGEPSDNTGRESPPFKCPGTCDAPSGGNGLRCEIELCGKKFLRPCALR